MPMIKNKKSPHKAGFTLLELIVALTILGIIGVCLSTFVIPQIKIFGAVNDQSSAKVACAGILNNIEEEIRNGKDFTITDNQLNYTVVTKDEELTGKTIDGDEIGNQYYPKFAHEMMKIKVTFEILSDSVNTTVLIYQLDGSTVASLTRKIYCPNISL